MKIVTQNKVCTLTVSALEYSIQNDAGEFTNNWWCKTEAS